MSQWSHYNPVSIQGGPGSFSGLSELTGPGGPWLFVTSAGFSRRGLTAQVQEALGGERVIVFDEVTPNPELDHLETATLDLRSHGIQGIIALGGGSAIDAAKVLAVTLVHPVEKPLTACLREGGVQSWKAALPLIAIPTTSGTGSEVTPFATVWDSTANKKHSVAGATLFPRYALLDPELTLTLPEDVTLHTGLDAVSHALESLWNRNRTGISEAHALQALRLANTALPGIVGEPQNLVLRDAAGQHARRPCHQPDQDCHCPRDFLSNDAALWCSSRPGLQFYPDSHHRYLSQGSPTIF